MSFCCTYKFILGMGVVVVVWKTWWMAGGTGKVKWQVARSRVLGVRDEQRKNRGKARTKAWKEKKRGKNNGRPLLSFCCI